MLKKYTETENFKVIDPQTFMPRSGVKKTDVLEGTKEEVLNWLQNNVKLISGRDTKTEDMLRYGFNKPTKGTFEEQIDLFAENQGMIYYIHQLPMLESDMKRMLHDQKIEDPIINISIVLKSFKIILTNN